MNVDRLYAELNRATGAADLQTEKNIAYMEPNVISVAETNSSSNVPDRSNTCVGINSPSRRSESGFISVTHDVDTSTGAQSAISMSTFQVPAIVVAMQPSVRDEVTNSELVGFGRSVNINHTHETSSTVTVTDYCNIHVEETSSLNPMQKSIIVAPNIAYGSVVRPSTQNQDSECDYPPPVEETAPHVYETVL